MLWIQLYNIYMFSIHISSIAVPATLSQPGSYSAPALWPSPPTAVPPSLSQPGGKSAPTVWPLPATSVAAAQSLLGRKCVPAPWPSPHADSACLLVCSCGRVTCGGSLSSLNVEVAIAPSAEKRLTQLGWLQYVTDKQTNGYGHLGPTQTVDSDCLPII